MAGTGLAVEGAAGLGHLLAQQLVAAGEQVLDVPPKLAARVRLLSAGDTNKNDPNDALPVAVAALRSPAPRPVTAEDHAVVLKVWAKRHRDLARSRNQAACRLHAVLCDLVPGGIRREISAGQAARILEQVKPSDAVTQARCELAAEFLTDIRRLDVQLKLAEGKTHKEALRALKRRISDAIYAALVADARQATAARIKGPGGQPGNHSVSRAAGSHPDHRLFGQATPGPPTTIRPRATAGRAPSPPNGTLRRRAGHSPAGSKKPPATA